MQLKVQGITLSAILLVMSSLAQATAFSIDEFTITRNGSMFFQDTFDNGDPMVTGYTFSNGNTAVYDTLPAVLPGTESGSRYVIDPTLGEAMNSPLSGLPIYIQRVRVVTNTSNNAADLGRGLKDDDSFTVTGVFDLVEPTLAGERYGVRISDRASGGTYDDVVEVTMQLTSSGTLVQFREQDVVNHNYNVFGSVEFTAAALGLSDADFAMYDQIAFILDRSTATSDIFGSFRLFDRDGVLGDYTYNFAGGATIFEGERFTTAEFIAVVPQSSVPEASSLSMLVLGLLALGGLSRRKHNVQ